MDNLERDEMSTYPNVNFKEILPTTEDYFMLFGTTGWNDVYGASAGELYNAISSSWYAVCAYDEADKLIGFGRVISDGVLYAVICDMIVEPKYQNQGIGSALLQWMIRKCKETNIRIIWLFAAADKSGFYKKHGFNERPLNAPGMQMKLNIAE